MKVHTSDLVQGIWKLPVPKMWGWQLPNILEKLGSQAHVAPAFIFQEIGSLEIWTKKNGKFETVLSESAESHLQVNPTLRILKCRLAENVGGQ